MTDALAITAGLQSLKSAFEIGKALLQLGVSAEVSARISEMNSRILAAQESAITSREYQSTLTQKIDDLKKHIAELETWDAEAETYKLEEVAGRGRRAVYAYTPKEGTHASEPFHLICARCFQDKHKSILQGEDTADHDQMLTCPRCKTDIYAARRYFNYA